MRAFLFRPLDPDRREEIRVLVIVRWVLLVAAGFVVEYRHGTTAWDWATLNALLVVAIALNARLHLGLRPGSSLTEAWPLAAGLFDLTGITAAIAAVDGFANPTFILYYPALLGFSLAFAGLTSILVGGTVMTAYVAAVAWGHTENIDAGSVDDQKALVLRLGSMAATILAANLVTRKERRLRTAAVSRELARREQVYALREHARTVEAAAEEERRHLLREIHDGVSQGVFMLSMGLDAASAKAGRDATDGELADRLTALGHLARETLLDTRGLLFDLNRALAGEGRIRELVESRAAEFMAVTGLPVKVDVRGEEVTVPANLGGEVYRVLQEGLSNVYRHSRATAASIVVSFDDRALVVEIADDGVGFETGATAREGHHGLSNMAHRAAAINGSLGVTSAPGEGTRLTLSVPLPGPSEDSRPGPGLKVPGVVPRP